MNTTINMASYYKKDLTSVCETGYRKGCSLHVTVDGGWEVVLKLEDIW